MVHDRNYSPRPIRNAGGAERQGSKDLAGPRGRSRRESRAFVFTIFFFFSRDPAQDKGEAALRISSSEPGEGLEADQRLYSWFAGTTGMALAERTRMLMGPEAPRREEDIAEALKKWCEQERLLQAHGDEYRLNAAFKFTALRVIMSC